MPLTTVFGLVGISLVFATFAGALAWGEHQTRHLPRTGSGKSPFVPTLTRYQENKDSVQSSGRTQELV
jgi:hypothetical protein